jgi:hypothetical protein
MTMPDGNSASESRRNADEATGEELREMYYEKALEDLVWQIMSGTGYPKRGNPSICLDMILREGADAARVSEVIRDALFDDYGIASGYNALQNGIESIVRDYLRDSKWHEMRIAEMIEEAKDEQG